MSDLHHSTSQGKHVRERAPGPRCIRYAGKAASAVFTFDEHGRAVRFDAQRPLGGGKNAKLTPWFGVSSEWRKFQGIEVPTRGEVGWQLPAGSYTYYRWQILDLDFNVAAPFSNEARSRPASHPRSAGQAAPITGPSR